MAGPFKLIDAGAGYWVRFLSSGGNILALSGRQENTESDAHGIFAMDEIAASALIGDRRRAATLAG